MILPDYASVWFYSTQDGPSCYLNSDAYFMFLGPIPPLGFVDVRLPPASDITLFRGYDPRALLESPVPDSFSQYSVGLSRHVHSIDGTGSSYMSEVTLTGVKYEDTSYNGCADAPGLVGNLVEETPGHSHTCTGTGPIGASSRADVPDFVTFRIAQRVRPGEDAARESRFSIDVVGIEEDSDGPGLGGSLPLALSLGLSLGLIGLVVMIVAVVVVVVIVVFVVVKKRREKESETPNIVGAPNFPKLTPDRPKTRRNSTRGVSGRKSSRKKDRKSSMKVKDVDLPSVDFLEFADPRSLTDLDPTFLCDLALEDPKTGKAKMQVGGDWDKVMVVRVRKCMTQSQLDSFDLESIERQLQMVVRLEPHPNVLRMMGCTVGAQLNLVTEWYDDGTLVEFIQSGFQRLGCEEEESEFGLTEKFHLLHQVCLGMKHLHSVSPSVIHGHLNPGSILICVSDEDTSLIPKVADYAFAALVGLTETIPPGFRAPEVVMREDVTEKADVWSFAMVTYCVMTQTTQPFPHSDFPVRTKPAIGRIPSRRPPPPPGLSRRTTSSLHLQAPHIVPDRTRTQSMRVFGVSDMSEEMKLATDPTFRPELDDDIIPSAVQRLISSCWNAEPNSRPSFAAISGSLKLFQGGFGVN